jgi:hypothetical protein
MDLMALLAGFEQTVRGHNSYFLVASIIITMCLLTDTRGGKRLVKLFLIGGRSIDRLHYFMFALFLLGIIATLVSRNGLLLFAVDIYAGLYIWLFFFRYDTPPGLREWKKRLLEEQKKKNNQPSELSKT